MEIKLDRHTDRTASTNGKEVLHRPQPDTVGLPNYTHSKSPLMLGCFLLLWLASVAFYGPRLRELVNSGGNVLEIILLTSFSILLLVFWMLSAYYVAVVLFSMLSKPIHRPENFPLDPAPPVAILYPTCNDFQKEAAQTCLNQNYSNFHLFLLDDSTKDDYRSLVDEFHAAHPDRATIVRRGSRKGFKAGNLNHALRSAAIGYPFFVTVDADERLPSNFLVRTIGYMQDPRLAFVQANHAPNPEQSSRFARDIGPTILPFWDVHCKPRNRYGFVVFLGHGALIRRSAWEAVDGFPEIITEDLGFSAALGIKGMKGIFLEDLLCYEDFPADYTTFKKQQERYLIGTTQVIFKFAKGLILSKNMSLVEKVDFFLWCTPLYVPAIVLLFVALGSIGLSVAFGQWQTPTVNILGSEFVFPIIRVLDEPYKLLCSWDFQIFSAICALSPAFASIALGFRKKLNAFKLIFLSTVPYLSLMVIAWRGILGFLLKGRVIFPPTGEQVIETKSNLDILTGTGTVSTNDHFTTWDAPTVLEICVGFVLAAASLISVNFGLFAVSCCLLIGAGIQTFGWDRMIIRIAAIGCFSIILLQIVLSLVLYSPTAGLVPLIFSVHF